VYRESISLCYCLAPRHFKGGKTHLISNSMNVRWTEWESGSFCKTLINVKYIDLWICYFFPSVVFYDWLRGADFVLSSWRSLSWLRNSPPFIRIVITVLTAARLWILFWGKWIQSTHSRPIYLRFTLILFSHVRLRLLSCLFLGLFRQTFGCICYPPRACYMYRPSPVILSS
jgi:hypothetical protein